MTHDPPSQSPPQGQLTVFPLIARAEMTVTDMVFGGMLPWQSPTLFGAMAYLEDDPADRQAVIVYEWPVPHWTVLSADLPKETVERMHLDRYCTDVLLATGELPYQTVSAGRNPPDFVASMQDGSDVAVDVTQLTATGRIAAQAQFERIRRAVLAQPRGDFAHLRGYLLYLWFRTAAGIGLPHREADAVEATVAALRSYQPDTSWLELSSVILPEQLNGMDMQTTESGCTFYAAELKEAAPSTAFFARTGFEMALASQTDHSVGQAWTELARLVERHDKPEIEHLVVTVGGPNRRGLAYPSEDMLLRTALTAGLPTLTPEHIESVVLHSWGNGSVIQLFPTPRALPPLFHGGYAVSHFSMVSPPEVHATAEASDA